MKYRKKMEDTFVTIDLLDFIETGGYILLFGGKEPVYVTEYRQRVEQRVLDLLAGSPVIEAIEHGESVSDSDLLDLERTLRHELSKQGIELSQENIYKAYGFKAGSLLEFVRRLLEIDALPDYDEIVRRRFATFISEHTFNGDQIRFLRAVQSVFLQKRKLALHDLYSAPLTSFGQNAVERFFTEEEIRGILAFTDTLVVNGGRNAN
jgi:type I restriction enzyme R subunit